MYTYTCMYIYIHWIDLFLIIDRERSTEFLGWFRINTGLPGATGSSKCLGLWCRSDGGNLRYQFGKPKIKQLKPEAFEWPGILPVYLWSDLEFLSPNVPKTCHELLQQRLMWCFLFLRSEENHSKRLDSFRNMDDCQCANLVRRGILVLDGFYIIPST